MTTDQNAQAQMGLTDRQRACFDAIEAHLANTRTMPSVEELRLALGLGAKTGVLRLLRQLEERGWIVRLPHRARAIRIAKGPCCARCGEQLTQREAAA